MRRRETRVFSEHGPEEIKEPFGVDGVGPPSHGPGHRRRCPRSASQTIHYPTCGSGSLLLHRLATRLPPLVSRQSVVVGRVAPRCGEVYVTDKPAWITDNALYPKRILRPLDVSRTNRMATRHS